MSQPILELLLDTNSFSDEKLARLNKFIEVFEKMEKFDKLKVSPISGAGITKLNEYLAQTEKSLNAIEKKMADLKQGADGAFSVTHVQNYNTTVRETAAARQAATAATTAATAAVTANTAAQVANISVMKQIGHTLTGWLGYLRNIAYILPGIGLAGIFDKIFKAVGDAAEALGIMNTALEKTMKLELDENKILLEKLKLYEKLFQLRLALDNTTGNNNVSGSDITESQNKAGGLAKDLALMEKAKDIQNKLMLSIDKIVGVGNSPETLGKDLDRRLKEIEAASDKLIALEKKYADQGKKDQTAEQARRRPIQMTEEQYKLKKETIEVDLKTKQDSYDKDKALFDEYRKLYIEDFELSTSLAKLKADEIRKIRYEEEKRRLDDIISTNEKIASDVTSSDDAILKAEKKMSDARKGLIALNVSYVTSDKTPDGRRSKTPAEIATATQEAAAASLKETLKWQQKDEDLREQFRMRDLNSRINLEKDIIDGEAEKNQRIFTDDSISLQDRLDAYRKYINGKLELIDLEHERAVAPKGLHENQIQEFDVHAQEEKVKVKANIEKESYQIVESSYARELKLIKEENALIEDRQKESYVTQLADLNTALEKKTISYSNYHRQVGLLNKKFVLESSDLNIKNDIKQIDNLKAELKKQEAARNVDIGRAANGDAGAKGALRADNDSILRTKLAIGAAEDKLNNDSKAREEARRAIIEEGQKRLEDNKNKIRRQAFEFAKNLIDQEAQYELDKLAYVKQQRDIQANNEIASIERSSLSAKDKAALETQLAEKKVEDDKTYAIQERKIKREAAMADRQLAIAEIIWNTQMAVTAALRVPLIGTELAISEAALGAIAVATVMATPIPSFAEGTKNFEGGIARYGEAGPELVKEPYKSPYLVMSETISYLPKGTEIIPIKDNAVQEREDTGWEQTRWLAKQMNKNSKKIDNKITNVIKIDLGFESYKRTILGN